MPTKIYFVIVNFAKVGAVRVILYLGAKTNFCPHFPYHLHNLSGIRYQISSRSLVVYL